MLKCALLVPRARVESVHSASHAQVRLLDDGKLVGVARGGANVVDHALEVPRRDSRVEGLEVAETVVLVTSWRERVGAALVLVLSEVRVLRVGRGGGVGAECVGHALRRERPWPTDEDAALTSPSMLPLAPVTMLTMYWGLVYVLLSALTLPVSALPVTAS